MTMRPGLPARGTLPLARSGLTPEYFSQEEAQGVFLSTKILPPEAQAAAWKSRCKPGSRR